jgi:hypothetical protein
VHCVAVLVLTCKTSVVLVSYLIFCEHVDIQVL